MIKLSILMVVGGMVAQMVLATIQVVVLILAGLVYLVFYLGSMTYVMLTGRE